MRGETDPDRRLYRLTGADALPFLQGRGAGEVRPLSRGAGLV